MNNKMKLFSYDSVDTPIHKLSGFTKLICFLLLTSAAMYSYDIRVILLMMVFSFIVLKYSQIKFSQIRLMFIYVLVEIFLEIIFYVYLVLGSWNDNVVIGYYSLIVGFCVVV